MYNITLEEYKELCEKAERIATIERLMNANSYVTVADILAILGIDKSEKEDA